MCALKTFNLDKEVYEEFSNHCKEHGISMSKKVENFIKQETKRLKSPEEFRNPVEEERQQRERKMKSGEEVDELGHPMDKYC